MQLLKKRTAKLFGRRTPSKRRVSSHERSVSNKLGSYRKQAIEFLESIYNILNNERESQSNKILDMSQVIYFINKAQHLSKAYKLRIMKDMEIFDTIIRLNSLPKVPTTVAKASAKKSPKKKLKFWNESRRYFTELKNINPNLSKIYYEEFLYRLIGGKSTETINSADIKLSFRSQGIDSKQWDHFYKLFVDITKHLNSLKRAEGISGDLYRLYQRNETVQSKIGGGTKIYKKM